jgi:hypothetical protein
MKELRRVFLVNIILFLQLNSGNIDILSYSYAEITIIMIAGKTK